MSNFQGKFLKMLCEDDDIDSTSTGEEQEADRQAFAADLDDGTSPGDYDVPTNPVADFEAHQTAQTTEILTNWVNNVESFIEQLNGLTPDSMNAQLNQTDCGSILSDVARSESKKISRIAQDLSSLGESLKQYLLTAQSKTSQKDTI
tara:strand:+ start:135 stop:575 length:441 start_codon:yes stop_codon:yes gene_type:complete